MQQPQFHSYEELSEGMTCEQDYVITPAVYEDFLRVFGDRSPLHVETGFAQKCGFGGVLMHGAILNGFVSNFIGMVFPGGKSLELSVDIRYQQPAYLGDTVRLQGKIAQKLDVQHVVVLHLKFKNQTRGGITATARVQVKMMIAEPH